MENILIAETDRIGDVILSLPVFKSIKEHNNNIKITALVRSYTADIFSSFQYIDNVISYTNIKAKENKEALIVKIKKENFDTALVLHPDYAIAKILKKAKIPNRYSYGWKWYQSLFSKVMIQHRSKNVQHQLEYNLDLLKLLKINEPIKDIRLFPAKESLKFIKNLLSQKKLDKKILIGIHPGSGHSSLNLPPDKYIELINHIKTRFKKVHIIITGTTEEHQLIDYILTNVTVSLFPMPLNLALSSLIALISQMKVFISNSTGPMHIASALNIPTIAFFSPIFIHSPIRWGPFWGKSLVMTPDINCHQKWKCLYRKCPYFNCFDNIKFEKILQFIKKNI